MLPQNATPSDVASQIAHQAELFRLPGNKGVRIQLHPDDLGGVQVTLRYAGNTGGLELHINVEHAATGALVESGWGQLRDALANQGINPDRLVMSISGPQNANQLDFSSNNNGGGYRPDQNLANFSQSDQSGQQRGEDATSDERGGARGWNPHDSPRQTSASSARIDYRV
jgi:flagellar hook-length control protein FliK